MRQNANAAAHAQAKTTKSNGAVWAHLFVYVSQIIKAGPAIWSTHLARSHATFPEMPDRSFLRLDIYSHHPKCANPRQITYAAHTTDCGYVCEGDKPVIFSWR